MFVVLEDTLQSHQDVKDKAKVSLEAEEAGLEVNALVRVIAVAEIHMCTTQMTVK